jgi:hypothetical protein
VAIKSVELNRVYMPIIPAFRRLREEDHKFKANLGYIVRFCFKKRARQRQTNPYSIAP